MYAIVKALSLIFRNYFGYYVCVLSNFEQAKKATAKQMGQKIKARREYLGLTQPELALAVEVQPATVSRYESGAITVDAPTLPRMAKFLRVPISFFFEDEENVAPNEIVYEPILDELHSASYSGGLDAGDVSEIAEIIRMKARRRAEREGRA